MLSAFSPSGLCTSVSICVRLDGRDTERASRKAFGLPGNHIPFPQEAESLTPERPISAERSSQGLCKMGAGVGTTCTVQSVTSQGPASGLAVGEETLGAIFWSEGTGAQSSRDPAKKPDRTKSPLSGATKLELEMEPRGSGATAVEQRLLRAETPEKNGLAMAGGQVERTLRWFTTVVLNAAFLGMVRAEAVTACTLSGLCATLLKWPGPGRMATILIKCEIDDPNVFQLQQTLLSFCIRNRGLCWCVPMALTVPRWLDRNMPSWEVFLGP